MTDTRKNLRLERYDYAAPGAYFVTVCAQDRVCLFGEVRGGRITENAAGKMIEAWWNTLPSKFANAGMDVHVVMPNHFHGILSIVGADPRVRPGRDPVANPGAHPGAHPGAPLPTMMQWFKTMTTNAYMRGVKQDGWQPFNGRLWQRNYYEHVIRDERELSLVREYIVNNPSQWALDRENPDGRQVQRNPAIAEIFGGNLP